MLIPTGDKSNLNIHEPGCCFSLLVVLHDFDVRCPSMESKFWGQNSGVKTWKTRFSPRQLQYATLGQLHEILHGGYFYT